jgi:glucose/arabinose dehydrogenase
MSSLSRAEPASKTPKDAREPIEPADHLPVTDEGVFGPAEGHSTRSLVIDPKDGSMYVGVGSMGNIAVEPKVKATIQKFDASGDVQSTFASGTRNPIGLSIHPSSGKLWAVVQERDGLGNRLVPDYLTEINQGDFFGWPYSYTGTNPQPGFSQRAPDKVKQAERPAVLFEAHSAPMDFAWIPDSWPEDMRGSAVVALKGSWNREDPTGYKVVVAHFEDGKPTGEYTNFVTGFWVRGKNRAEVWGRPADVAFLPDGGLLIADDSGGTIWKVKPRKGG